MRGGRLSEPLLWCVPRWRRPFHAINQLFWAVFSKMSAARRVVLLLALALALLGANSILPIVLLVLLFMELADEAECTTVIATHDVHRIDSFGLRQITPQLIAGESARQVRAVFLG